MRWVKTGRVAEKGVLHERLEGLRRTRQPASDRATLTCSLPEPGRRRASRRGRVRAASGRGTPHDSCRGPRRTCRPEPPGGKSRVGGYTPSSPDRGLARSLARLQRRWCPAGRRTLARCRRPGDLRLGTVLDGDAGDVGPMERPSTRQPALWRDSDTRRHQLRSRPSRCPAGLAPSAIVFAPPSFSSSE